MTSGESTGKVVFHQPGRVWGALALAALVAIYALDLFNSRGPGREVWFRVVLVGAVLLLIVSAVMRWRAQITVDSDGVRARTQVFRRSRSVTWADVHHFELRGYWRGLGVRTVDGRWVPLMATGAYGETAIGIWEQLERIRVQRQHAS